MDNLEQMLQNVLSDPDMMQKIMGLAQTLGGDSRQAADPPAGQAPTPPVPGPDMAALGKLSGMLKETSLDSRQQALLSALSPYMQTYRIEKLRRAMQAAKMAGLASSVLGRNPNPGR